MIEKVGTVEAGGRITGDLVIEGDLTVEGSSTYTYDELVEGGIVIDTTGAEAFLVRKASDGGDVFTIDSSGEIIQINSHDGSTKGLKLGTTLVTSTASELNILDGATLSTTELNYVDGVTSAIQTQLDAKAPTASPTFTGTITIGSAEISETELEILDGATVTTAELNILDGVTATATELNYLDITTLGTVEASKVVTADASGNINFNNGNMTNVDIDSGAIDGTDITVGTGKTLDVSSGTLTLGANQISGDKIDGGTISTFASTGIDDNAVSNALTIDSSQNLSITSGTLEVYSNITTGAGNRDISLTPHGTGEVAVNSTLDADALKINGTLVSATATELNVLDGITSSTAELNILDGVTSTASELNVLDGVTGFIDDDTMGTASATTIASAESIKAYVDAQDHDASDESVGGDLSGTVANATIVNDAVTYAKMQDVSATDRVLGRDSAGSGIVEEISPSSLRTMINVEDGATADQTDAEIRTAVENATDSNVFTDADHSKLDGIEASADVTDATNVASAGAVMESDTTTASMSFVVDEDDMSSNSATKLATQQSIKAYVDSVAQGLNVKTACAVATTANITLSGEQTIDGVTTSTSRVLVKDQTDASENGIYVSASGAWARATDLDAPQEVASSFVFITSGTNNADTGWVCTNEPESVTVGTDDITFSQFSDAGHITSGTGLTKTGNTLSVNASQTQITSVGALNAGSITSGFGSIDNGSSNITTTGVGSFGSLDISGASAIDGTATFAGVIRGANGSASAPEFSFTNNTDSGMYSPADNQLAFTSGGTQALIFGGDQSATFASTVQGTSLYAQKGANGTQVLAHFLNTEQSNDASQIKIGSSTSNKNSLVVGFETVGDDNSGNYGYLGMNSVGNAIVIDASNNVGIGTTAPTTKLQVKAGSTEEDVILLEDNSGTDIGALKIHGGAFVMKGKSSTAPVQLQTHDGNEDIEVDPDGFIKFETAGIERVRIDSSGRVGIGTSSPDTKLELETGGVIDVQLRLTAANTRGASVEYISGQSSGSTYNWRVGSNIVNSNAFQFVPSTAADGTTFSTPAISIKNTGSVGIGTASPVSTTHIYENTTATDSSAGLTIEQAGTGDAILQFLETGTQRWVVGLDNSDGDKFKIASDGDLNTNARLTIIPASGNVGIGTSSPVNDLHLAGAANTAVYLKITNATTGNTANDGSAIGIDADGDLIIHNAEAKDTKFYTSDTERMRIDSSGNVLIGRTSVGSTGDGHSIRGADSAIFSRDGGEAVIMNRDGAHGVILSLRDDGVQVGTISTNANSLPSDRNFKRDITDLDIGLNFVNDLKPSYYNHKIDDADSPKMMGLIAQDVEQSLIDSGVAKNSTWLLQHEPVEDEKESDYHLDYVKLVPVLIKAVQELSAKVEALENA